MDLLIPRYDAINIYTDGSCIPRPRRGGMGVRLLFVDSDGNEDFEDHELQGHFGATNNQMELKACIAGLELAFHHARGHSFQKRVVVSDSRYVTENWRAAQGVWRATGWYTKDGSPVQHVDLWKDLTYWLARMGRPVEFRWVKGHAKDPHNRAVDALARSSAKNVINPLFNPPLAVVQVCRKLGNRSVKVGCVPLLGQTLPVRILTCQYLRTQRLYKYKYEVLPTGGNYDGSIDLAFSSLVLSRAHHYEVVLSQTKPALFVSMSKELER